MRDGAVLRARLVEAASAGEVIRIVYRGGSQPGSVREVLPLAVLDTALRGRAYRRKRDLWGEERRRQ